MTTRNAENKVEREVQEMLARATPAQMKRLLHDIMATAPAAKEPVKYDA